MSEIWVRSPIPTVRLISKIRDLDQTAIGNPAHGLIRLGLSLAATARGSDLSGVTTAKMIEQMMEGDEEALADRNPDLRGRRPQCVPVVMRQTVRRTWAHLAKSVSRIAVGIAAVQITLPVLPRRRCRGECLCQRL
jgi:uncharacterized protein (DUF2252 family)